MVLDEEALAARPKNEGDEKGAKGDKNKEVVSFGKELRGLFVMAEGYRNLNQASFGTIPRAIRTKLRYYQDMAEARPDPFLRYEYLSYLDRSRAAIAKYIDTPLDGTVFVSNATTAVNVVLRNLAAEWRRRGRNGEHHGKDAAAAAKVNEILHFDTVYVGCGKSIDYVVDTSGGSITRRELRLRYPCEDEEVVQVLRDGIAASRAASRIPCLALFDVVSSLPGVCVPWKQLARVCREEGVLSLVDGAQGVGMVELDVAQGDPDFFVSNCHKWMHVPRGCAVLYAREGSARAALRSTLPTSHGYEPVSTKGATRFMPPLHEGEAAPNAKWARNFDFVGTADNAPFFCVADSIAWRREVLGGEARIVAYLHRLAREGGKKVADALGTEVMENESLTLGKCGMTNVALPVFVGGFEHEHGYGPGQKPGSSSTGVAVTRLHDDGREPERVAAWVQTVLMRQWDTFIPAFAYRKRIWVRLSAQVFLDMQDFEWAASVLEKACAMLERGGDWKQQEVAN